MLDHIFHPLNEAGKLWPILLLYLLDLLILLLTGLRVDVGRAAHRLLVARVEVLLHAQLLVRHAHGRQLRELLRVARVLGARGVGGLRNAAATGGTSAQSRSV